MALPDCTELAMKERQPMHANAHASQTFTETFTGFFTGRPRRQATALRAAQTIEAAEQLALARPALAQHWQKIAAEGVTAAQFIEFLQPLADLEGLSVTPGTESSFFALK